MKNNPDDNRDQPSDRIPGPGDATRYGEFIQLFSQHHSHILAYIYKLVHDHHDADDLFQRTSIVLWTRFDSFEPGSNFLAWACQIAYFEACNFLRTSGRDRLRFNDDLLALLADEQQVLPDESDRRLEALTGCLKKLGGKDREVVRHHVVAVVDREQGTASHFIDGKKTDSTSWALDAPMYFGPSVIGGFTRLSGEDGQRDFRGRMDELVLFNRALGESEVLELFEAGNGF